MDVPSLLAAAGGRAVALCCPSCCAVALTDAERVEALVLVPPEPWISMDLHGVQWFSDGFYMILLTFKCFLAVFCLRRRLFEALSGHVTHVFI